MILFRTTDTLNTKKDREIFMNYFLTQARKAGLEILEYDLDHIRLQGYKWNFLKYYVSSVKVSVQHGQKLSNEIKRVISILFWR